MRKISCKICGVELILKGRSLGFFENIEYLYLFSEELFECPNCKMKYKRALDLDKFVYDNKTSFKSSIIDDTLFEATMNNLDENNKECLESFFDQIELNKLEIRNISGCEIYKEGKKII